MGSTAFKAFVASTYEDLKGHRAHVISALRKGGFYVDPMEDWTAATGEPKIFSQDRINGCDLCVLLVAWRRGNIPAGETLSITQLEYHAAVNRDIDILVFMLKENAHWPRMFDELDKDEGVRAWRKELEAKRGISFFDNDPQSVEIGPSLMRWLAEKYRKMEEAFEALRQRIHLEQSRTSYALESARSSMSLIQSIEAE